MNRKKKPFPPFLQSTATSWDVEASVERNEKWVGETSADVQQAWSEEQRHVILSCFSIRESAGFRLYPTVRCSFSQQSVCFSCTAHRRHGKVVRLQVWMSGLFSERSHQPPLRAKSLCSRKCLISGSNDAPLIFYAKPNVRVPCTLSQTFFILIVKKINCRSEIDQKHYK